MLNVKCRQIKGSFEKINEIDIFRETFLLYHKLYQAFLVNNILIEIL